MENFWGVKFAREIGIKFDILFGVPLVMSARFMLTGQDIGWV